MLERSPREKADPGAAVELSGGAALRSGSPRALSAGQVASYDLDGYVLPAMRAMSPEEASELRARVEALEAAEGGPAIALLFHGHTRYRWLYDVATSPAILDRVQDLIGPNIMVWGFTPFVKEPKTTDYIGWHHDSNHWGIKPFDGIVTAWVALTDVGEVNGPMEFMRGSHLGAEAPQEDSYHPDNMLSRGQEIKWPGPVDPARVARATMRAGEFSLHHVRIAHYSGPNSGDDRRIGLAIRYMPTSTTSECQEDVAMLVRGTDAYGHFAAEHPPAVVPEGQPPAPEDVEQFERGRAVKGTILFRGTDAEKLRHRELERVRRQSRL